MRGICYTAFVKPGCSLISQPHTLIIQPVILPFGVILDLEETAQYTISIDAIVNGTSRSRLGWSGLLLVLRDFFYFFWIRCPSRLE
jgi:hypothetical protein